MDFHPVEGNLRESFRVLAEGRRSGDVRELPGVSIASLGVAFQMFNAAFLSQPVKSVTELDERVRTARDYFSERRMQWAFWLCESWLPVPVRRRAAQSFEAMGLRLASEMPGMAAETVRTPTRWLPPLEVLPVADARTLAHFRTIGSTCFRVPPDWFAEVFDNNLAARPDFPCWVGYHEGLPVATAASVTRDGVIGLYNVATMPDRRDRGFGEAVTRFAVEAALARHPGHAVILQSTAQGLPLYERMGFRGVTRIVVFNSR